MVTLRLLSRSIRCPNLITGVAQLVLLANAASLFADDPTKLSVDRGNATAPAIAQRNAKPRPMPAKKQQKSAVPDQFSPDMSLGMAGMNVDEERAVKRVGSEIREALSLRPTLVVWLLELSSAAESLRRGSIDSIGQVMQQLGDEHPGKLEMAVIGYDVAVHWATPNPTKKADELKSALANLKGKNSERINLYGAVRQAVEKFAARTSSGSEVMFVVVGASSGDDLSDADPVLVSLKRAAIEVFGIGPAARFGPSVAQTVRGRTQREPSDEHTPSESLFAERIRLALPGQQGMSDLGDSGYGPFGLERLCRQSGGRFFRLRDMAMIGWEIDPTTGGIKAELLERYTPDYVDEAQYRRLLAENKCRMALHNAALLPAQIGLEAMSAEFVPSSNEAQLAKNITRAQEAAAIKDQPMQQLYDALVAGESERTNLTGARWQAGYDLAMGRALSAKARLEGYNAMLATLKQGKKFANPESKRWVLEPADEIAAASALDKMAKSSRVYLKRVIEQHQGTPWAAVAQRELQFPAGWKFVEK
ncbi:MAG: VWA domain-containing protein [Pirellulales bacterium]|nr:VWA domain-containing protein [Pirellulales bacterium]